MYYTEEVTLQTESPVEKVLRLALELPATRPELEAEALRVEALLDGLQAPASPLGEELMVQLVDLLESQLDGIYGLLDGDDEQFQASLTLLVECDARLQSLESQVEEWRDEVPPLVA